MQEPNDFIIPGPSLQEREIALPLEITTEMRAVFTDLHDKYFAMESKYLSQNDFSFNERCSALIKGKLYTKYGMDQVAHCYLSHIFGSTFDEIKITRFDFEGEDSIEKFINSEYEKFKSESAKHE